MRAEKTEYNLVKISETAAQEVMGWTLVGVRWFTLKGDEAVPTGYGVAEATGCKRWNPTDDWGSAMALVEAIRAAGGWNFEVSNTEVGRVRCLLQNPFTRQFGFAKSEVGPLAVTLAALQAMGVKLHTLVM